MRSFDCSINPGAISIYGGISDIDPWVIIDLLALDDLRRLLLSPSLYDFMGIIYNTDRYSNSLIMKIYLFVLIVLVFHLKGGECYNHKRNLQKSRNLQTIAQNCSIPNTSVTSNMMPIGICPQQIFIIQLGIGNPAQNLFYIVDTGE